MNRVRAMAFACVLLAGTILSTIGIADDYCPGVENGDFEDGTLSPWVPYGDAYALAIDGSFGDFGVVRLQ